DGWHHVIGLEPPVVCAAAQEFGHAAEVDRVGGHPELEVTGCSRRFAPRSDVTDRAGEVHAVDALHAAHRHPDGKIEAWILAVLVDEAERREAPSRLAIRQIARKELRERNPYPIRDAEAELQLVPALAAGRSVLEVIDGVAFAGHGHIVGQS